MNMGTGIPDTGMTPIGVEPFAFQRVIVCAPSMQSFELPWSPIRFQTTRTRLLRVIDSKKSNQSIGASLPFIEPFNAVPR